MLNYRNIYYIYNQFTYKKNYNQFHLSPQAQIKPNISLDHKVNVKLENLEGQI